MLKKAYNGLRSITHIISATIRRAFAHYCMNPTFLIIGAQKSGTTSLFRYLTQHPDILKPQTSKELHYFDLHYNRGLNWYLSHFPLQKKFKITCDKSPYYLYHPLAPKRAYDFKPRLKLIALLRDPVKRAYSHYHHEIENKRENRSFRSAVENEMERVETDHIRLARYEIDYSATHQRYSYFARGRYVEQIDRWMEFFSRKQIYIETAERFFHDPQTVCTEIFDFLGLQPFTPSTHKLHNPGKYDPIHESDRCWLAKLYLSTNEKLAISYGVDISSWT